MAFTIGRKPNASQSSAAHTSTVARRFIGKKSSLVNSLLLLTALAAGGIARI